MRKLGRSDEELEFSIFDSYRLKVLREKIICDHLNRLILKDQIFYGRVWIPEELDATVRQTLEQLAKKFGTAKTEITFRNYKSTNLMPPTFFKTNEFTAPFQQIVETYGIPRYREVNPGIFTIVTFPYQFGVMFGDIGHGGLLLAFGIYLVMNDASIRKGPLAPASELRYLFLLMGIFAFYNGIIYNDFFGIPLRLFGSCYDEEFERKGDDCVVPVGIDPIWYQAVNEVPFLNSFKMKLSIIIGVIHMCFGILMRAFNNIHFNKVTDFVFEFVPQLTFMLVTFGYMCVAVCIKWLTNWEGNESPAAILNIYTGMGFTVSY